MTEPFKPSMEFARQFVGHRLALKALPRRAAELYLDDHLPDITDEERAYALALAGQHIRLPTKAKPQDALFCAAMFQVGVSLGDLAKLLGIKKPTVHQKIGRKLNDAERKQRDRLDALDLEVLAMCYHTFNMALQVEANCFDDQYPRDIGRALLTSSIAIIAADRGNEDGPGFNAVGVNPSRPRRYSNMNQPSGKEQAAAIVQQVGQPLPTPDSPTDPPVITPSQPANVVRPEEQSFLESL